MSGRRRCFELTLWISILLAGSFAPAAANARLDADEALVKSEAAIGNVIGDYNLVGSDGSKLRISEFRGRPLAISLVYTSCSAICPVTTQNLKNAVVEARRAMGEDAFVVLTVGFDARQDTPARLAAFASDQDIDGDPLWYVASGDAVSIAGLLEDLGFSYSAAAGGFEHVAQTTILDANGQVYRQVYGDAFPIQVFVEPLKELILGTTTRSVSISDLADRIRFLCTVYDPRSGRYRTDYTIFAGMTLGAVSLVVMGWMIVGLWRGNRRHLRLRARPPK